MTIGATRVVQVQYFGVHACADVQRIRFRSLPFHPCCFITSKFDMCVRVAELTPVQVSLYDLCLPLPAFDSLLAKHSAMLQAAVATATERLTASKEYSSALTAAKKQGLTDGAGSGDHMSSEALSAPSMLRSYLFSLLWHSILHRSPDIFVPPPSPSDAKDRELLLAVYANFVTRQRLQPSEQTLTSLDCAGKVSDVIWVHDGVIRVVALSGKTMTN